MNTKLEEACKLVAERIPGWEWSPKSGEWFTPDKMVRDGYLLTGNGMVELMEALRKQTKDDVVVQLNGEKWIAYVGGDEVEAGTPQDALVLAAAKLVEDMK